MGLTKKQIHDLNNMNVAAQNVQLGDIINAEASEDVSITVSETVTGEAGTQASVENVGTNTEVKLKFTIPKGDKGDKGETGAQGPAGEKGDKGDTGPQGPAGKDAVLTPATTLAIGAVKQSAAVAEAAGENVTKAEFKALLDALKAAGIMANS